MHRSLSSPSLGLALLLVFSASGCGSNDATPSATNQGGAGGSGGSSGNAGASGMAGASGAAGAGAAAGSAGSAGGAGMSIAPINLETDCKDEVTAVFGNQTNLPTEKGAILACAPAQTLDKAQVNAFAKALGYEGQELPSGIRSYQVSYRTERGDAQSSPGFSSALVVLPDAPIADKVPLVVVGHGTVGQAGKCAPARQDFDGKNDTFWADHHRTLLPLVGRGFAVIATDYAGYAGYGSAGNPPSGYANSLDVGKSMLDASHALKNLIGSRTTTEVAFVGHSQGGHSALSALALSATYPAAGEIKGVVTYAPLWLSQRSWGGMLLSVATGGAFKFSTNPFPGAVGLWYHYSQAELLDGPGEGVKLFADMAQSNVKQFFDGNCRTGDYSLLQSVGDEPEEIYQKQFVDSIALAAALGVECPMNAPEAGICQEWLTRYQIDRPRLTGKAAEVPILLNWGTGDKTIGFDRITCATERLEADKANYEVCITEGADHGSIVGKTAANASSWLAAKFGLATAPTACGKPTIMTDMGQPAMCNPIPPND